MMLESLESNSESVEVKTRLGELANVQINGKFANEYCRIYSDFRALANIEEQKDISAALSSNRASKTKMKTRSICAAWQLVLWESPSSIVIDKHLAEQLMAVVDGLNLISHAELYRQVKDEKQVDPNIINWCLDPIVQFSDNINIQLQATADDACIECYAGNTIIA
ncbi:hypothetical protein V8E36_000732 [Tilletia maclaganii]